MHLDNLTRTVPDDNTTNINLNLSGISSIISPKSVHFQANSTVDLSTTAPISMKNSTVPSHLETGFKKKRSSYSRNGCKECKRRKLKCDETKPACWQCTRLGKICVYLDKEELKRMKNEAKKNSLKFQKDKEEITTGSVPQGKKEFEVKFAKPLTIDRNLPFNYEEQSQKTSKDKPIPDLFNFNSMDVEFKNFFNDEKLLNDLNSLATEILDDISISPSSTIGSFTSSDLTSDPTSLLALDSSSEINSSTNISTNQDQLHQISSSVKSWEQIDLSEILSQFTALPQTHQGDLKTFLLKTSNFLFPFNQNLLIKILSKHAIHCKYLLYAMLSLSSRNPSYKKQYLGICFKSMKDIFEKADHDNQTESLILAILLLATDSTSKDWKFHLRGAKDILLKVIRNKKLILSPGLLLAKSWFIAIEILARLEGIGITTSEAELDELLNYDRFQGEIDGYNQMQIADNIGLLLSNGYDLFLGYSKELLDFYKYFFHLQSLSRKNGLFQLSTENLLQLMKLAEQSLNFEIIDKAIIISSDSPYHPTNPSMVAKPMRDSCFASNHQTGIYFSWFDLTHQLHVMSLLMRAYLQFLPYQSNSHIVQDLICKMIQLCHFYTVSVNLSPTNPTEEDLERFITISNDEDPRLLLLQGPMIQMGLCSINPVERYKIRLYFNSLIKFGVPSALGSLHKLENVWNGISPLDFDGESTKNDAVPFA